MEWGAGLHVTAHMWRSEENSGVVGSHITRLEEPAHRSHWVVLLAPQLAFLYVSGMLILALTLTEHLPKPCHFSACPCSLGGLWFLSLQLTMDVFPQTPLNLCKNSPHFSECPWMSIQSSQWIRPTPLQPPHSPFSTPFISKLLVNPVRVSHQTMECLDINSSVVHLVHMVLLSTNRYLFPLQSH